MSTKLKNRKKFDLMTMIGPLDVPVEPKTLQECLHEAGGFPFVAKAILWVEGCEFNPVGCERTLTGIQGDGAYIYEESTEMAIEPVIKRWQLLGHKT